MVGCKTVNSVRAIVFHWTITPSLASLALGVIIQETLALPWVNYYVIHHLLFLLHNIQCQWYLQYSSQMFDVSSQWCTQLHNCCKEMRDSDDNQIIVCIWLSSSGYDTASHWLRLLGTRVQPTYIFWPICSLNSKFMRTYFLFGWGGGGGGVGCWMWQQSGVLCRLLVVCGTQPVCEGPGFDSWLRYRFFSNRWSSFIRPTVTDPYMT